MAPNDPPPVDDDELVDLGAPKIGPFRPPAGYRFEDELQGPTPREIPAELRRGRQGRQRSRMAWGGLVAGAIVTAGGLGPAALPSGIYSLPLVLETWLGLFFLAIGVIGLVRNIGWPGPYRYVRDGTPFIAQIVAIERQTLWVHSNHWRSVAYKATLQYRDPRTGAIRDADAISNPFSVGPATTPMASTYRVGEYVTAVSLPDDPEAPPRLYGFLELRDGLGLVRRDGRPGGAWDESFALLIALSLGIVTFIGSIYALFRYAPLAIGGGTVALLIVAGVLAAGLGVFAVWALLPEAPEADTADGPPARPGLGFRLLSGLVALFGGGMIALGSAFAANAVLDPNPPREEPIVVEKAREVGHRLGLRDYKISYHFLRGDPRRHDFDGTADHLDRFANAPAPAQAVVGLGRFGWPWVIDLRPAAGRPGP